MEFSFFKIQVNRLKATFGPDNFSDEKIKLIWAELRSLPNQNGEQIVSWCIGEFSPNYPPKVSHFREQAEAQLKRIRQFETAQAAKNWKNSLEARETDGTGLTKALSELGAKSLLEAIKKTKQG